MSFFFLCPFLTVGSLIPSFFGILLSTHRLLSSSLLGLPYYRILNMNHRKELLRSLWVSSISWGPDFVTFTTLTWLWEAVD